MAQKQSKSVNGRSDARPYKFG